MKWGFGGSVLNKVLLRKTPVTLCEKTDVRTYFNFKTAASQTNIYTEIPFLIIYIKLKVYFSTNNPCKGRMGGGWPRGGRVVTLEGIKYKQILDKHTALQLFIHCVRNYFILC